MKTKLKIIALALGLGVLSFLIGYMFITKALPKDEEMESKLPQFEKARENRAELMKELEKKQTEQPKQPDTKLGIADDTPEYIMIDLLHCATHSWAWAEDKWCW
jgi:hypothetical protein